jgi:hypothetical protein
MSTNVASGTGHTRCIPSIADAMHPSARRMERIVQRTRPEAAAGTSRLTCVTPVEEADQGVILTHHALFPQHHHHT